MNTKHLVNKHVFFKMANSSQSEGTVAASEEHGLWISLASEPKLDGITFPKDMKQPLLFVPFHQLEWLLRSM